ncbi:hypothetical protein LEP1GSC123_3829 [Leptospira borgpetersenii str. 200701203]|uniref:Uncharacterized protein n=2 Tax=Leptospira borgpetersenii TaxID=174 RepID=M3H2N4_LEPBO|nr:hypothetical protein LEP1GSC123_3829 [Leptospira borgpetersenii str. 200701203]EMN18252.1 hypothetical protein LEP1GSC056_1654 [Leptospira borgpetersenii str. Brem 328]
MLKPKRIRFRITEVRKNKFFSDLTRLPLGKLKFMHELNRMKF